MKYNIKDRVLQDLPDFSEKQKKYEADKASRINWKPTFSRIKILPDPEQLSGLIDSPEGWRESLTRGTIVSVGPEAGYRDGVEIEHFYVGQRILFLSAHVMKYTGTDGVTHHFLKENSDVNSIIAIEPIRESGLGANDSTLDTLANIQENLDKTSVIAKSLRGNSNV